MSSRSRLGFIVPSVNTVVEEELRRLLPDDLSYNVARVALGTGDLRSQLAELESSVPVEAAKLADAGVSAIVLACTAGSMVGGPGYDAEVARAITAAAGVPATTATTALLDALRVLRVGDITVGTPYPAWLHQLELEFLAGHGFEVQGFPLGLGPPEVLAAVTPAALAADVVSSVRALPRTPSCVVVSCANARALEAVPVLEDELRVPVVTSNQVTLWAGVRLTGGTVRGPGWSRLAEALGSDR